MKNLFLEHFLLPLTFSKPLEITLKLERTGEQNERLCSENS